MKLTKDENGVCTKLILFGFGGSCMANYEGSRVIHNYNTRPFGEFVRDMRLAVEEYQKKYEEEEYSLIENQAVIEATTSSLQEDTEENLTKFGFIRAYGPLISPKYEGKSLLSCWCFPAPDFTRTLEMHEAHINSNGGKEYGNEA